MVTWSSRLATAGPQNTCLQEAQGWGFPMACVYALATLCG